MQQEPIDTAKPSSDLRQQCGTLGCKPVAWNVSSSYSLSSAARTASQHGVFTPNFVIASEWSARTKAPLKETRAYTF